MIPWCHSINTGFLPRYFWPQKLQQWGTQDFPDGGGGGAVPTLYSCAKTYYLAKNYPKTWVVGEGEERRSLQRTVRILLECILVCQGFCRKLRENEGNWTRGAFLALPWTRQWSDKWISWIRPYRITLWSRTCVLTCWNWTVDRSCVCPSVGHKSLNQQLC